MGGPQWDPQTQPELSDRDRGSQTAPPPARGGSWLCWDGWNRVTVWGVCWSHGPGPRRLHEERSPGRRRSWRRREGPCAALMKGEGEKAGCVSGPQQGHWARAGLVLAGWVWAVVGVPACGEEGVYEYVSMHVCVYRCICVRTHVWGCVQRVPVCVHGHLSVYECTRAHTRECVHVHVSVRICVHIHTHA